MDKHFSPLETCQTSPNWAGKPYTDYKQAVSAMFMKYLSRNMTKTTIYQKVDKIRLSFWKPVPLARILLEACICPESQLLLVTIGVDYFPVVCAMLCCISNCVHSVGVKWCVDLQLCNSGYLTLFFICAGLEHKNNDISQNYVSSCSEQLSSHSVSAARGSRGECTWLVMRDAGLWV